MGFPYLVILLLVLPISGIGRFVFAESITPDLATDREALISFKSQLSTEPPSVLSTWNQTLSPCNWTRVKCDMYGQRVVELDLSGLGLIGSISPHIGNLSFLRSLQLQNNRFTGILPNQLGNLYRLTVFNASSNSIEGVLPPNISRCTELRIVDLMRNEISGEIPKELNHLINLQVLNLGRNRFLGSIPPSLGNLSSLDVLNLGTNTLGGMIPPDLGRLGNLKHLDLTINSLTGVVPPSIYNMSSLVSLALASNNLWGSIPTNVGVTLPNLLVFNFCFNNFTGTIPGSLHNLTKIQIIRMANNSLHGTVPPGLANLPVLEMYNIGFNKIVSSGTNGLSFLTSLTNSTRLDFLAIDGNLLEGVIPDSIGNLSKILTTLYMGGNNISGRIPASIGQLRGLELLDLSGNALFGEIPVEVGQLEKLQELGLASNHFSGHIPNSLGYLQSLNMIDLSWNELAGTIPTTFGNFNKLLSMDLSNNMLNGSIPKEVLNLPSLSTFLNLSKNFLDGPLPQEIGMLQSVATINLSENLLSGNIPDSIGNCKSLEEFFASKNKLNGPIPASLGEVKGLETLDVSLNQLSGSLPRALEDLEALQLLNLSFNNLEGELPKGGVFTNLSYKVHLEGNTKLCLRLACQNHRNHSVRSSFVRIVVPTAAATLAVCLAFALFLYMRKSKEMIIRPSESLKRHHPMVTYDELRLATENFSQQNLIGWGSFGSVYRGYLKEGIAIAVKVLDVQRTGSWKGFSAECAALRHSKHRNLLKLITSCSSIDSKNMEFLALVYEFMSNGSLEDWVKGNGREQNGIGWSIMDRLNVAIDVACALNYLHHECETPVVHCDLKPSNILLDEDMTAKVGDFGLARLLMERTEGRESVTSTNALKGSIGYIPPEYGMGAKPSTAGDVYSYGIVLLELFTGKSPTHESFVAGLSLKNWVQQAFPANIEQVLDPELLLKMGDSCHYDQLISTETQLDCLITVMGVGLSCSSDSPDGRMIMKDVVRKLKSAKDSFLKPDLTINKGIY
ncbi:hypothetical protein RJ640_006919 [Escallonia rubra]|uniref:non-specific serine/threonine protein kinase n=1 Tax=Escallonia rubra TaxID=112253 RepID=A0AA88RMI0_9ASTE|nr:hypothetical protein RJ640_006919 [Escallonia rubra]